MAQTSRRGTVLRATRPTASLRGRMAISTDRWEIRTDAMILQLTAAYIGMTTAPGPSGRTTAQDPGVQMSVTDRAISLLGPTTTPTNHRKAETSATIPLPTAEPIGSILDPILIATHY